MGFVTKVQSSSERDISLANPRWWRTDFSDFYVKNNHRKNHQTDGYRFFRFFWFQIPFFLKSLNTYRKKKEGKKGSVRQCNQSLENNMMFKPHIFDVASLQHSQLHLCRFMCVCIRLGRYLTRVLFVRSRGYKYQDMCWPKNSNAHERTYPCVHQPPSQLLLSKPQCATCWTIALVWRTKSVERPETSAAFGTTVLQLVSQTNHVLVKLNWIPKKSCIFILVTHSPEMFNETGKSLPKVRMDTSGL